MSSPYYLAIDVRADAVTAAIAEPAGADRIRVSSLRLGIDGALPAAVFVAADELLFGDAAIERGAAEPDSVTRDFFPHEGAQDASLRLADEEFSRIDLYACGRRDRQSGRGGSRRTRLRNLGGGPRPVERCPSRRCR